jgi:hypothetical protein
LCAYADYQGFRARLTVDEAPIARHQCAETTALQPLACRPPFRQVRDSAPDAG